MPYFTRRPYAETATVPAAPPGAPTDFLALARDALSPAAGTPVRQPLRVRAPIRPGGSGAMTLDLALEEAGSPVAVSLSASDLVGPAGRIPAAAIRIAPASLTLSPDGAAPVEVTVHAPAQASPGRYAGTLVVTGDERLVLPIEAVVS